MRSKLRAVLLILTLIGLAFRDAVAASSTIPRFAYVANGQDDTVSIFAVEKAHLRAAGYVYVGPGSNPLSVTVAPSQRFLYVARLSYGNTSPYTRLAVRNWTGIQYFSHPF
jgi:6-phosphogluconolactonase (cycloisomerase 2 family)